LRSIALDGPSPIGGAGPGAGPIAVGALPFDDRTPGSLVVPALVVMRGSDGRGWVTTTGPEHARLAVDPALFPPRHDVPAAGPGRTAHRNGGYSAPALSGSTVGSHANGFPAPPGAEVDVREDPARAVWTESVRRVLAAIDAGDVRKVVLARRLTVDAAASFDRRVVLDRLRRSHPSCFTYAAGGFVGASP